jgi:formylglycine-generating enzyme required for sulfatase activity/tRNA A-37 threonylcarbamoyl transferase component Bud32
VVVALGWLTGRSINQPVVIKTLNQKQQNQADFALQQEKFFNEAMTLKGLSHPHIVQVYELIQENGLWGIVMEYIAGQELAAHILDRGALTEPEALGYIEQVGQALIYVHEKGLLHRDIKPHNIMLRPGGKEAVLIDFGLARGFIDGQTLSMTNSHTPAYAPVEQFDRQGRFGPYTDVYALAATLYHSLTGEAPFLPAKGRWEAQQQGQSIDHFLWGKIPKEVSERTKQGIIEGMEVLPGDRPQTMAQFLALLPEQPENEEPQLTEELQSRSNPIPSSFSIASSATVTEQPETPRPPTPVGTKTRRNFLRWLGFGGMSAIGVIALSQLNKNSSGSLPSESILALPQTTNSPKLTKAQFTSIKLNERGQSTDKPISTAEVFSEDLGGGIGLTMVKIPAGEFMMGQSTEEKQQIIKQYGEDFYRKYASDETPQHVVKVPQFYLGQNLVTQEQWETVIGNNPSSFKSDSKLPVDSVSWLDAMEFCQKLSKKTGRPYQLPSEAKWEYACRSGTKTPFAFGETITPEVVNYHGSYPYGGAVKGEFRNKTTPVGIFPPNLYGLYDMHRNLWEWCLDEYISSYREASDDSNARGDISSRDGNKERSLRGGAWNLYPFYSRSANREPYKASNHNKNFSLRVALVWSL